MLKERLWKNKKSNKFGKELNLILRIKQMKMSNKKLELSILLLIKPRAIGSFRGITGNKIVTDKDKIYVKS